MNYVPAQPDRDAHQHRSLEIVIVLGGKAIQQTTSGDYPCKAGEIYLIPPGIWHAYTNCRDFELYNCQLSQPLLDGPLGWTNEDSSLMSLLKPVPWLGNSQLLTWKLRSAYFAEARVLLTELLDEYQRKNHSRWGRLLARLLLLLDFIANHARPAFAPITGSVHSVVRRAAHELCSNVARAWSLPELAGELGIHPGHLVRIFRLATGSTPMKFLAKERANKAAQLLLSSDLPISEIGMRVGWDDPKKLSRCFHQHFGESATEFRLRLSRPMQKSRSVGSRTSTT